MSKSSKIEIVHCSERIAQLEKQLELERERLKQHEKPIVVDETPTAQRSGNDYPDVEEWIRYGSIPGKWKLEGMQTDSIWYGSCCFSHRGRQGDYCISGRSRRERGEGSVEDATETSSRKYVWNNGRGKVRAERQKVKGYGNFREVEVSPPKKIAQFTFRTPKTPVEKPSPSKEVVVDKDNDVSMNWKEVDYGNWRTWHGTCSNGIIAVRVVAR